MTAQTLTVAQIATLLNVSRMSVYRLVRMGDLRAYRFGRSLRVRTDDFEAYMRGAEIGGGE